jgi:hypothetical protein
VHADSEACFPIKNEPLFIPNVGQLGIQSIDTALNKFYGSLNSFVAFPPLAVTKNDQNMNTIQAGRSWSLQETTTASVLSRPAEPST